MIFTTTTITVNHKQQLEGGGHVSFLSERLWENSSSTCIKGWLVTLDICFKMKIVDSLQLIIQEELWYNQIKIQFYKTKSTKVIGWFNGVEFSMWFCSLNIKSWI